MKKNYTTQEKIAYFETRIKSLKAKLASEQREGRLLQRLEDLERRIDETAKKLAEEKGRNEG